MKKNVFGRQFKRDRNERKALFKSLLSSLVMQQRIRTTEAKAKAIKRDADKIITLAKKGAERFLAMYISEPAIKKLTLEIAPRFANRQGGYTRIIRLQRRLSDDAQMVLIEWVEGNSKLKTQNSKLENKEVEQEVEEKAKPTRRSSKIAPISQKPQTARKTRTTTKEKVK